MTTREEIIAAAKKADPGFDPESLETLSNSIVGEEAIERFYAIAYEAGAASREAEIAAEQAKNDGLKNIVKSASSYVDILGGYSKGYRQALSATSDTSALEAIVKKAGEAMRDRVTDKCYQLGIISSDGRFISEIRALPAVTLEDLK